MMMPRGYELKNKEVININTAEKLGYVADVEIEEKDGSIKSLIVPGRFGIWSKITKKELVIPWDMIEVIGKDVILVKLLETM